MKPGQYGTGPWLHAPRKKSRQQREDAMQRAIIRLANAALVATLLLAAYAAIAAPLPEYTTPAGPEWTACTTKGC